MTASAPKTAAALAAPPGRRAWQQARARWLAWLQDQHIAPARFQQQAWKAYEAGQSGLITAPTGSGKTLAAIGGPLMQALAHTHDQRPVQGVRILWVTPLRALASDTAAHLVQPVEALLPYWRTAMRTGDGSARDKAAAQKGRANLLVTTPESLAILLSSEAGSESFRTLQAVIVDEWHELLPSKRGVLLQLNLARLRRLAPCVQVWGLSATIGNLDEALHVLVRERAPTQMAIVQDQRPKPFVLSTLIPPERVHLPWAGHLGLANLGEVLQQLLQKQSSIVFTNTRAQAELWFTALSSIWPLAPDTLAIHHGSLDLAVRQQVEAGLRTQQLRCVVATSSLDLGVDFPAVDLVIQVGGAHSVARMVQRAGRARHRPGEPVHITAVATQALEMCEFAALRELAQARAFEARPPLVGSLDVLSQHTMSMALAGGFDGPALLAEVHTTHSFADLTDAQWQAVLAFLVHGGQALDAYPQYRRLVQNAQGHYVPADAKVARRHRMGIGTITDQSMVAVQFLRGARLGSVEESFISKLAPGDVFNFAGRSLELFRVENTTAWVRKSSQKSTLTPAWTGGNLPFSDQVGQRMKALLHAAGHGQTPLAPEMAYLQPLLELQARRSSIPGMQELLIECIASREKRTAKKAATQSAGSQPAAPLWFIYPFAGRVVHEALALLLAHRLARVQPNTITWSCNHIGLMLAPAVPLDEDLLHWPTLLSSEQLHEDLASAVNFTEIARRRFRDIAQIAGLLQSRMPGARATSRQLQVSAGLLFDVLSKYDPGHVLIESAKREAIEHELHSAPLLALLQTLAGYTIALHRPERHTPLSFGLWAESLRGQLSNESWAVRIRRAAQQQGS